MRIAMIALGSQGDVQPYIALGKGLKEAGHTIRLITHLNYEQPVSLQGLEFCPVQGNVQEIVESPEMRELLEKGNFFAINAHTAKLAQRAAISWAQDGLVACEGMDLIIAGIGGLYIGLAIAEKLQIPLLQAFLFPFTPTSAFPGVLFPQSVAKLGGAVNRLSHHLLRQIMWQGSRDADRIVRQQVLDLPAAPFFGPSNAAPLRSYPTLYGFSPSVIPNGVFTKRF
jgi:sterol 3beta-glucosyltransferase